MTGWIKIPDMPLIQALSEREAGEFQGTPCNW
jgi:hypothetical protein